MVTKQKGATFTLGKDDSDHSLYQIPKYVLFSY